MKEFKYFLFWNFALILRIIRYVFNKESDLKEYKAKIVERFGESFLIFLFFFEKHLSKNKNINTANDIIKKKNIDSNSFNQNKKYIFLLIIFLLRLINILFAYPSFYIYITKLDTKIINYICQILILNLLSNFLGLIIYYSHHYLAIILIFITLIIDIINDYSKKLLIELIFIILNNITDALCILIYKYLNEIIFINIFLIGCLDGFFHLIICLIFELFFPLFNIETLSFFDIIIRGNGLLNFILSFFTGLIYYIFYFKIIQLFNPCYISILYCCLSLLSFSKRPIEALILLFGVGIYLEIIILNFCNFDINTEKQISNRAYEKTIYIDEDDKNPINTSLNISFTNYE